MFFKLIVIPIPNFALGPRYVFLVGKSLPQKVFMICYFIQT